MVCGCASIDESSTNFAYQKTGKTKHQVGLFDFLCLYIISSCMCTNMQHVAKALEAHTSVFVSLKMEKRERERDADSCSHVAFIEL